MLKISSAAFTDTKPHYNIPVSYTHLNQKIGGVTWVYLGTFEFDKGNNDYGMVVLSNESSEHGVVSVSYTHLDVYKRQDKGSNNVFSIIYSHKSKKVPIFTTSIFYYSPLNVKIMASRRDVYKRQAKLSKSVHTERKTHG